jgi:hypothetical protein
MAGRIRQRRGGADRKGDHPHLLDLEGVHQRFEVAHQAVEREVVDVALGQTDAAMVEAHEATGLRRPFVHGAQPGRLPFALDVRAGEGGVHQHGALAKRPEGDAHAVPRARVPDGRIHRGILRGERPDGHGWIACAEAGAT